MADDPAERAIDVSALGKRFGNRWIIRGATMSVSSGEAVALLGPNGSGKTTLLRVIATVLRPNSGTVRVRGLDAVKDAAAVRARVGYLAHQPGLYEDLTARENLAFACDMLALPHEGVDHALERVGLARDARSRVRGFSAGMLRRLALARLLLRRPEVLILDEPYSNLDSDGVGIMNAVIAEVVRSGGAALVAAHELAPAKGLFNRTVTLVNGRIAGDRAEAGVLQVAGSGA